jgi:2-C-methyl-D-erythritol 4-phosphate cytidylyltransferase
MYSPLPQAWAVVPAGGLAQRFGGDNKLLALLGHKPVLQVTLEALAQASSVVGLVLCVPEALRAVYQAVVAQSNLGDLQVMWATGGKTRQQSVYNGLLVVPADVAIVTIHDAARPLLAPHLLDEAVYRVATGVPAVIAGVRVHDTLKQVLPMPTPVAQANTLAPVVQTLDRSQYWLAHTPQTFNRAMLLTAHQQGATNPALVATDDSQLFEEAYPGKAFMLADSPRNLKITTPHDVALAHALQAMAWVVAG